MKTLFLLRHAKSGWDDDRQDDHDRSLTAQGERACSTLGHWLAAAAMVPELALCSSARRAVDTLDGILTHSGAKPVVRVERGLYLASAGSLLESVTLVEDEVTSLMLVGHNPSMHSLAAHLAGSGDSASMERLASQFPPAALAVLRVPVDSWREVEADSGELLHCITPRFLKDG